MYLNYILVTLLIVLTLNLYLRELVLHIKTILSLFFINVSSFIGNCSGFKELY